MIRLYTADLQFEPYRGILPRGNAAISLEKLPFILKKHPSPPETLASRRKSNYSAGNAATPPEKDPEKPPEAS